MAFNADIQYAVGKGARDAEQHVALAELTPVQGHGRALLDPARQQLRRARDAPAVAAAVGQRHALRLQRVEQRHAPIDTEGGAVPVGKRDRELSHPQSQISEVQSPPG